MIAAVRSRCLSAAMWSAHRRRSSHDRKGSLEKRASVSVHPSECLTSRFQSGNLLTATRKHVEVVEFDFHALPRLALEFVGAI